MLKIHLGPGDFPTGNTNETTNETTNSPNTNANETTNSPKMSNTNETTNSPSNATNSRSPNANIMARSRTFSVPEILGQGRLTLNALNKFSLEWFDEAKPSVDEIHTAFELFSCDARINFEEIREMKKKKEKTGMHMGGGDEWELKGVEQKDFRRKTGVFGQFLESLERWREAGEDVAELKREVLEFGREMAVDA